MVRDAEARQRRLHGDWIDEFRPRGEQVVLLVDFENLVSARRPACPTAEHAGEEHVVLGDHCGPVAVVAACGGCLLAFEGLLADVVAVELGGDGEYCDGPCLGR